MPQTLLFIRPDGREGEMQLWSDLDLDEMAMIGEAEQRRAAAYWRRWLPARLRTVLDAKLTTEGVSMTVLDLLISFVIALVAGLGIAAAVLLVDDWVEDRVRVKER